MAKKVIRKKGAVAPTAVRPAAPQPSHPSPIYKHVPGGGLERCVWNQSENEYDCEPIDSGEIPNGAGIYPPS
jgi:hypothetical protein